MMVAQWIVARDQSFTEIESPEFRAMICAACQGSPNSIHFPSAEAIHRRIMNMATSTQEGIRDLVKVGLVVRLSYLVNH